MIGAGKTHKKRHDSRFFIYAAMVVLAVSAFLLIYENESAQNTILKSMSAQLEDKLVVRQSMIKSSIEANALKVRFLFSTPPVSGIVRSIQNQGVDPLDGTSTERWKLRLNTIFVGFIENNPDIFQIRYIQAEDGGRELIRVERRHGKVSVTPTALLQQKAGRDYFQEIQKLEPGELYVSDINLNRERGRLEYPYRPTYRVGMPVFDEQFHFFGVIIINIDADALLKPLQQNLHERFVLYLLNTDGAFILHPDTDRSFAFETGDNSAWGTDFQALSSENPDETIKKAKNIRSGTELYFAEADVQLAGAEFGRHLKLIVGLKASDIAAMARTQRNNLWFITGIVVVLAMLLIATYQYFISQKIDLSEALSQYEAIVSGSTDAIVGMDKNAVVTSWNDSANDIFGIPGRAALNHSVLELMVSNRSTAGMLEAIKKVLAGDLVAPFTIEAIRRNGSRLPVSVTLSPIAGPTGGIVGMAAIMRDITDQVAIEAQLQNMNASLEQQVAERTRELEVARNEALSASRSKSEFVANISHEIRTPLNGVAGMLRLLKRGSLSEQQRHYLKIAENSCVILSALINDVLDVSKIEAGKLDIEQVEFDMMRLACDLGLSMAIKAQDKKLEYILDVAEINHRYLLGDAHRIRQILTNLISNAIKFTEQGEIIISLRTLRQNGDEVLVQGCVRDTGVGISEEGLQRLFDAFSQEDSSVTRRYGGTGLGLSISRQLCQLMGGDIAVASKKGRGSVFSFDLRLMNAIRDHNEVPVLDLHGHQIAIAHPNVTARKTLAFQLSQWQARVLEHDGGIQTLLEGVAGQVIAPDIIIIDQVLFDNNAVLEMFERLPQKRPAVMVLKNGVVGSESNLQSGSISWINKPVTPFDLGRRLSQILFPDSGMGQFEREDTEYDFDQAAFEQYAGTRILLVDDNEVNQEVAAGLIGELGFVISRAYNGREAIELIRSQQEHPFSLVFMDCQMPVLDGYTATQLIRSGEAGESNQDVIVIAMTANAMSGDMERCLQAGMNDYLTKPVDPQALEMKMLYWLSRVGLGVVSDETLPRLETLQLSKEDSEQPVWDREALFKRVRRSEGRLTELVTMFVEMLPERRQRLHTAVADKHMADIASLSHALKGSASSLGGMRVHAHAEALELAAKSESKQAIDQAWVCLSASCDELEAALRQDISAA